MASDDVSYADLIVSDWQQNTFMKSLKFSERLENIVKHQTKCFHFSHEEVRNAVPENDFRIFNLDTGEYDTGDIDRILRVNIKADEHFRDNGSCPNCGQPMELPACRCGCERHNDEWVMCHYRMIGDDSVCDDEKPLWWWLELSNNRLLEDSGGHK